MTRFLLLLTLVGIIGSIFSTELPGAWWQWLLATAAALCAAGVASNEEGR